MPAAGRGTTENLIREQGGEKAWRSVTECVSANAALFLREPQFEFLPFERFLQSF